MFIASTQQIKKILMISLLLCCVLSGCSNVKESIVSINDNSVSVDYLDTKVRIELNNDVDQDYSIKDLKNGCSIELKDSQYKQPIEINLSAKEKNLLIISIKENINLFSYEYFIEYNLNENTYALKVGDSQNTILTYKEDSIQSNDKTIIMLDGYIEILPYINSNVEWEKIGFSDSQDGYKKRDIFYVIQIYNTINREKAL